MNDDYNIRFTNKAKAVAPRTAYKSFMMKYVPHLTISFSARYLSMCTINVLIGRLLAEIKESTLTAYGLFKSIGNSLFSVDVRERRRIFWARRRGGSFKVSSTSNDLHDPSISKWNLPEVRGISSNDPPWWWGRWGRRNPRNEAINSYVVDDEVLWGNL